MADATGGVVTTFEKQNFAEMYFEYFVENASQMYPGIGAAVMPDGGIAPADTAGALFTLGRAEQSVLGTGSTGPTCRVTQGLFRWTGGTNPPVAANRGQTCYWQDDQTVTMTPGTLPAGVVEAVDTLGAYVWTGYGFGPAVNMVYLSLFMSNIVGGTGDVYYIPSPLAGYIVSLTAIVQGAALTTGNATLTGKIGTTAITGGVVTLVQASSAVGNVFTAYPTAANLVAVGSAINFTVGGTQASSSAQCNLLIGINAA